MSEQCKRIVDMLGEVLLYRESEISAADVRLLKQKHVPKNYDGNSNQIEHCSQHQAYVSCI